MKLKCLRISNFQSYGPSPTEIFLDDLSVLIGPNGSGKTATLHALCRLFAFDPSLRRVLASDFHISNAIKSDSEELELWIEADFSFEELKTGEGGLATVPTHLAHMRLDDPAGVPRVRYRLEASKDAVGEIDYDLYYVTTVNPDGSPAQKTLVRKADRHHVQLHYLPARRDPATHISYGLNALLGRLLRSAQWDEERQEVDDLTCQTADCLANNAALSAFNEILEKEWQSLHKGEYYKEPQVDFSSSEIESLLKRLSLVFSPGHEHDVVNFSRLSDGHQSLLYLSLVLAAQQVGREIIKGNDIGFDSGKLRPAAFTMFAMEEPENSLAPYYLGRIITALSDTSIASDAQTILATHAPSILRRVEPEQIRYLRLSPDRHTIVSSISVPEKETEAHKFVEQAVRAYPEIYFARIVVLGEGASEELVLPRLFEAHGLATDLNGIAVAPLGGKHVNHFWRLLSSLGIPYVTLLDLDLARHQGGWGRIKYMVDQLKAFAPDSYSLQIKNIDKLPQWNTDDYPFLNYPNYIETAERDGIFFSAPLDLDFAMLESFAAAFNLAPEDQIAPSVSKKKAVLGDSFHGAEQYSDEQQNLFTAYHKLFKIGSKPAHHLQALSSLSDEAIQASAPASLQRMIEKVRLMLQELPE